MLFHNDNLQKTALISLYLSDFWFRFLISVICRLTWHKKMTHTQKLNSNDSNFIVVLASKLSGFLLYLSMKHNKCLCRSQMCNKPGLSTLQAWRSIYILIPHMLVFAQEINHACRQTCIFTKAAGILSLRVIGIQAHHAQSHTWVSPLHKVITQMCTHAQEHWQVHYVILLRRQWCDWQNHSMCL